MRTTLLKLTNVRARLLLSALSLYAASGCGEAETVGPLDSIEASIVYGRPAADSEIHSTVALYDQAFGTFCTGTLIAPHVVLTAAHCVYVESRVIAPQEVHVVAGLLDARGLSSDDLYAVRQVIAHADYDQSTLIHDVALLVLAEPIEIMNPAVTLSVEDFDANVRHGTLLTITGYGLEHQDGQTAGLLNIAETPFKERAEYDFIAGDQQTPDTCFGDSGGPAYLPLDGSMVIVGITSYGLPHETLRCGVGTVYMFVPAYFDWINTSLSGSEPPQTPSSSVPGSDPGRSPLPNPAPPANAPRSSAQGCRVGGQMPTNGLAMLLLAGLLLRRHRGSKKSPRVAAVIGDGALAQSLPRRLATNAGSGSHSDETSTSVPLGSRMTMRRWP